MLKDGLSLSMTDEGPRLKPFDLFKRIEILAKERMKSEKIVSLRDYQKLHARKSAHVILIVEDDEVLRNLLRRICESEGYQVLLAKDATELSQVIEGQILSFILLDVGLPWINGFELAEMLKNHPDLNHIPLVFISGLTEIQDLKKGFAVGADDFLTKPFDVHEIKKTIKTLLSLAFD